MLASLMTAYSCGTVGDSHPIPLPSCECKITTKKRDCQTIVPFFTLILFSIKIVTWLLGPDKSPLLHQNLDDTLGSTPVPSVGK